MKLQSVFDEAFLEYGKVLEGYDFSELLKVLEETTEKPADHVIYVPGDPALEALPVCTELKDRFYGGMPIQVGYCNGYNTKLNCVEYHRDSEVNIAADEIVLMVAKLQSVRGGKLDTSLVEAFILPKGTAVQCYETTLHYAPASSKSSFRVIVVLPKGTNTDKPDIKAANHEDSLLRARNKWLIAHPESAEAGDGAYVGLTGKNIDLKDL